MNKICKTLILIGLLLPLSSCLNVTLPGLSGDSSTTSSSTNSSSFNSGTNQENTLILNNINTPVSLNDSYSDVETSIDGVTLEYSKAKNSSKHVYIGKTGFIRNAESSQLGQITSFTINYSLIISSDMSKQNTFGFGYLKYRSSNFYVDNPNDYGIDITEVDQDYTVTFSNDYPSYLSFYTPRDIEINSLFISYKDMKVSHQKEDFTIQVFSTNDLHGQVKGTSSYPGLSAMSKKIKELSTEKDQFNIIIDQGDIYQGTAEAGLSNGYNMDDYLIQTGYESTTLGNHEFDWGKDNIVNHYNYLDIPILANNIRYTSNNQSPNYCKPYKLISRNGVKIGIIGSIGNTYSSISSSKVSDIKFLTGSSLTEQIKKDSTTLKEMGAKFIILSIHDGADSANSSQISSYYDVNSLSGSYVDLVLEGHTHQTYKMKDSKNVWHLQSGGNGSSLMVSELNCTYNSITNDYEVSMSTNNDAVTQYSTNSIIASGKDSVMEEIDAWYKTYQYGKIQSEVVGKNVPYMDDDNFEDLLAQIYYDKAIEVLGTSYSQTPVLGGGYIKTRTPYNLSGGTVLFGDLYNLLPFDNDMVLCSISGSKLLSRFINNTNADYHIYGPAMTMTISSSNTYYIITDSYSSDYSSNGLTVVRNLTEENLMRYARDIFAEYLRENYL